MSDEVTVFVKAGDPTCSRMVSYLTERNIAHTTRDVLNDPSASAILFGRLGRITVPALQQGDRLIVGFDPLQLARFFPPDADEVPGVTFGAAVRAVTSELAQQYGLPGPYGVEVGRVNPNSVAEGAGIEPGDVVLAIGPYTIQDADQFTRAVAMRQPGDTMMLTIWRKGQREQRSVVFPLAKEESTI